jgi:hypothetical protein
MTHNETLIGQIREFLKQLTPGTRSRLLAEVERLKSCDVEMTGFEVILAELRTEFLSGDESNDRGGHPSRYFFQPLEPILADHGLERANIGQISQGSLPAVWDWINQDLLPTMARDYVTTMKRALATNNLREAGQVANAFQIKVGKYLETTLNSADTAERMRAALAMYTSSRVAFDDVIKMLCVLRSREALAEFNKALPPRIDKLGDEQLAKLWGRLDALRKKSADAIPFALMMITRRLKTPWQLIRLATRTTRSKAAADIAATPYAIAVSMVLEQLDERRSALRHALRANRIPIAKDILAEIHLIEDTLRKNLDLLDESEWGRRLAELMKAVAVMVEAETRTLPGNIRHVLGSRSSRGRGSLIGRLTYLASRGVDVLTGGAAYCRQLVN